MSKLKGLHRLLFIIVVAMLVASGHAATVYAAGTKTVEACGFAAYPTAEIVSHLPYPPDWKVVVVCNEIVWDTLMRQVKVNFISDYAFTFQPNHVTFIRARIFLEPTPYTPEQVLSHELGHVVCRCDDEELLWTWADQLMQVWGRSSPRPAERSSAGSTARSAFQR